jgi:phosphomevalonate kinase
VTIVARAPGKLVVLGEYAVLAGGPALVMAVDRYCVARLEPSSDADCHLQIQTDTSTRMSFAPGQASGAGLVDLVTGRWPRDPRAPWRAELDSSALFGSRCKLGLGSSAAALTAWAGAWAAYTSKPVPGVTELIRLHRAWQAGAGSGLDIAASRLGGVLQYQLSEDGTPDIVSVRLPDSVGFLGVFSGQASSTGNLVGRFREWQDLDPGAAHTQIDRLRQIAEEGISAARANAAEDFLLAAAGYADALDALGRALGAEIVTAAHRKIARLAGRFGLTYKVSGAGGGDAGLAFGMDAEALEQFAAAVPPGYEVLRLKIDTSGLVTE